MARRHHYRRRKIEPLDLDMTTFLNLMVVLVPFLLITAVFSRITIVELTMPSAAGAAAVADPKFRVEVIVRESGLEITNSKSVIAAIPKIEGEYDLATLSDMIVSLKQDHPEANDASVLLEPNIEYDHLIAVMDVVRSTSMPLDVVAAGGALAVKSDVATTTNVDVAGDNGEKVMTQVALFTDISIGDAP